MNSRSLALLGTLAVLATGVAGYAVRNADHPAQNSAKGKLLFPDLPTRTGDIVRIEIDSAGEATVLERRDNSWILPAKSNYPADPDRIGQLLGTIAHLDLLEEKTSDAARYADLGLGPPGKDLGAGKEIKLLDAKGGVMADAVIGRNAMSLGRTGGGFYVRRADQPASWLVEGMIEIPQTAMEWTKHNLFGLSDPGTIRSAVVSEDEKTIVTVSRNKPEDEDFTVVPAPPGRLDQGKALRLATMPVSLSFDDIRAVSANDEDATRSATFQAFSGGISYRIQAYGTDKDIWARVSESGDGDTVRQFNAFHAKWLYKLPPYRGDLLLSSLKDFAAKEDPDAKSARKPK